MSDRGSIFVSSHRAMAVLLTTFALCALTLAPAGKAATHKVGIDTAKTSAPEIPAVERAAQRPQNLIAVTHAAVQLGSASPRAAQRVSDGSIPLSFEPNQGQADSRVSFMARGLGYALFLTPREAVLELKAAAGNQIPVVRMKLDGTSAEGRKLSGIDELPGKANYLLGRDASKWHTGIPTYGKVIEREAYPGINLVYYGRQRQLEFDFVVAPGADSSAIRLQIDGARKLRLDSAGNLVLSIPGGELSFLKPVAYQQFGSQRRAVKAEYIIDGQGELGFRVGQYDRAQPLVIDPILAYSTYLGGTGIDGANAIAVLSSDGTAFVTGGTFSIDFPTEHPLQPNDGGSLDFPQDAFVAKLSADGATVLYATYLGGTLEDEGNGIAVDSLGDAYVTGMTLSKDFPVTPGSFDPNCPPDAQCGAKINDGLIWSAGFLSKLNPAGSALVYSTYLGGSGNTRGQSVAVDNDQNAYVTGPTQAPDFPVGGAQCLAWAGPQNAFLLKLDSTGSAALYSGTFGGTVANQAQDSGLGVAVDGSGNASMTGITYSSSFGTTASAFQPAYGGAGDGFLTTINSNLCGAGPASILYSTYLGGSGLDQGNGVAVDSTGKVYVTGLTKSTAFPTTAGVYQATCKLNSQNGCDGDAFVSKFDPNLSGSASLLYSTYVGGSAGDSGNGISVDLNNNAFIAGATNSTDFPVSTAVFQPAYGGGNADAFVTELNPSGAALVYSTYLGGSNTESGNGIAVDTLGAAYVAGQTCSTDFPLSNPAHITPGGNCDAFISKVIVAPGIALSPSGLTFAPQLVNTTSAPKAITLDNGDSALTITSITISGNDAGDFAQTNDCGTTQPPGGKCTISVTFTPAASGTRTASISIVDSAPGSPHVVNLSGTGNPTGILSLSPTSLAFGNENVGSTSSAQSIQATNTGNAALTISSITASGDYSETDNCTKASLQPTTNCTIQVTFKPSVSGSSTGALTITDDAPGSPHEVLLTGNGVLADFSVSTSAPSETTAAGTAVKFGVAVTPNDGFSSPVSLGCQLPSALADTTCTISPASVTPDGTNPAQATVTITTTARSVVPPGPTSINWPFSHIPGPVAALAAMLALALLAIMARRRKILLGFGVVALSAAMCIGCGSGKSFGVSGNENGTGTTTGNGTPAGTYTVSINATSGSVTRGTTIHLTVN
ncbi:MAG TPA: SBBP repeat-containing protein [Terriglobia bacterium]|nr:SBBP repeat-containing protein [Terriglobia bacterium]